MFDNEIDWVNSASCSCPRTNCREAAEGTRVEIARIQGRAHARNSSKLRVLAVFKVRRVSLGVRLGSA
jgi:hypothetical protein